MNVFEKNSCVGRLRAIADSIENGLDEQALEQARLLLQDFEQDVWAEREIRMKARAEELAAHRAASAEEKAARDAAKSAREFDIGQKVRVNVNYAPNQRVGFSSRPRYLTGTIVGDAPDGKVKVKLLKTGGVRTVDKRAILLDEGNSKMNNELFEAILNG